MADKKIDAWMPLHIGPYMAATGHLSAQEHGMYLLLLMHAWTNGGGIPADDERIRRICRAESKEWTRSRSTIMDFFAKQEDGSYRQKRLEMERAKAVEVVSSKSEGGKKGAAARWQKRRKDAIPNGIPNGIPIETPMAVPMRPQCPIQEQPQEPPRPSDSEQPPPPGGGEDACHALAAICAMNRVSGAQFNSPVVSQWVREGVTLDVLREAIAEARRTGKPVPELIPVRYLMPIVERVRSGCGKPVDNAWRRDEKRAVAKGRECGLEPRKGEELFQFVQRIDDVLREQSRREVA